MLVITMNKEKFSSIMESICKKYINLTNIKTEESYDFSTKYLSSFKRITSMGTYLKGDSGKLITLETHVKNYEIFRQAALYKTMAEMHEGNVISVDEKTSEFIQLYNNV